MTALRDVVKHYESWFVDEEHRKLCIEADDEWQKAKHSKLDLDYARAAKATEKAHRYKMKSEGY